jgi:hypothetical protein
MNPTQRYSRPRILILLLGWFATLGAWPAPVRASDPLGTPFSELATRELCKQLKDKQIPFHHAALSGHLAAVEPETRLSVEVRDFKLGGDVVLAKLHSTGRFKIDGKANLKTEGQTGVPCDLGILADAELTIVIESRFSKEGQQYFVEPRVQDLAVTLKFLEFTPANLSGSEELLTSLARAAFARYKDQIIAEINGRLGKQPF